MTSRPAPGLTLPELLLVLALLGLLAGVDLPGLETPVGRVGHGSAPREFGCATGTVAAACNTWQKSNTVFFSCGMGFTIFLFKPRAFLICP